MSPLLIGLHGLARTGKDTLAAYLAAHFGLYSYAFAQPLKEALAQMFNLSQDQLEGAAKEQIIDWLGRSPRQLMQLLGTEWGRNQVHPQLWLLIAEQQINAVLSLDQSPYAGVIVRDVRFANEAEWIRAQGGTVVHVLRPDAAQVNQHSSESQLPIADNDLVVLNNSTLDELYDQAELLMQRLLSRQRYAA